MNPCKYGFCLYGLVSLKYKMPHYILHTHTHTHTLATLFGELPGNTVCIFHPYPRQMIWSQEARGRSGVGCSTGCHSNRRHHISGSWWVIWSGCHGNTYPLLRFAWALFGNKDDAPPHSQSLRVLFEWLADTFTNLVSLIRTPTVISVHCSWACDDVCRPDSCQTGWRLTTASLTCQRSIAVDLRRGHWDGGRCPNVPLWHLSAPTWISGNSFTGICMCQRETMGCFRYPNTQRAPFHWQVWATDIVKVWTCFFIETFI